MLKLSYAAAIIAALILTAATVAWVRIRRDPRDDLTIGQGGKPDSTRLKTASYLIVTALAVGGIAAAAAVFARFSLN